MYDETEVPPPKILIGKMHHNVGVHNMKTVNLKLICYIHLKIMWLTIIPCH